jgi:ribosome-binding protein aMBF1 (putative translation factor)
MGTRECEVCGREAYSLFKRNIEGVIMEVCSDCRNMGEEPKVERKQRVRQAIRSNNTQKFQSMYAKPRMPASPYKKTNLPYSRKDRIANLKLVDNAIELLIKVRNQHKLTTQQFALSLLIKENYLKRIEKRTTSMPINLAQRIEKKYKITLTEREDSTEDDDYSQFLKKNRSQGESMVYFKNTGTQKQAREEQEDN